MRKASLAEAKAHLSELVDAAEHKGAKILILRHGKPAAAIVPVALVVEPKKTKRAMTPAQADAFLDDLIARAPAPDLSAVEDLLQSRR